MNALLDFDTFNRTTVIDAFLLLLIGIGPKLALVPFLNITVGMPIAEKRAVLRQMIITATAVAAFLLLLGGLLTRLLHFSTAALSIASGAILFITAVRMVLARDDPSIGKSSLQGKSPMQLAIVPLGVPYLLNPVGIVVLVTASAEAESIGLIITVVAMLFGVLALDVVVFNWANKVNESLVENRMLVIEIVFGFLLAALAVQLVFSGLADLGVLDLSST